MAAVQERPTSIRIRKLEPWVIDTHSNLAKNEGISFEEYLRRMLRNQALKVQEDFADEMDVIRAEIAATLKGDIPNSEDVIREIREESC